MALALAPVASTAATTDEISVPGVYGYIRHLVVQQGVPLAIALPPGEVNLGTVIGDKGWEMLPAVGGDGSHITLKALKLMPTPTLLQIYGSTRTWYLIVSAPPKVESTAYVVDLYDPHAKRQATPKSKLNPKPQAVGCKANDPRYKVSGDKRILVQSVCEDELHTLIVVNMNRDSPNALPYAVDSTGREDRIGNATPAQIGPNTYVWEFDGQYRRMAMVSSSNRGQIRKTIEYQGAP